jgi:hypothetical protein
MKVAMKRALGTRLLDGTMGGMATRLADLPQPLASAVARARARVAVRPTTFPRREIDPVIAAWVTDAIASGVLAEAIVEVANADPELA